MGCCFSKDPGQGDQRDLVDSGVPPDSRSPSTNHARGEQGHPHAHHIQLQDRFNQPLRRHVWTSKKPVTQQQLRARREEFFDTRVTGRPEIWSAVRMAIETMGSDLETAQGILEASGITVPTGDLINGVYDEFGNHYDVPDYCISDPTNLINSPDVPTQDQDDDELEKGTETDDDDQDDDVYSEEAENRREEKGKMPVHSGDKEFTVIARLSDGGTDVQVAFSKNDTVKIIARRVRTMAGLSGNDCKVKIAYLGRILREDEPLRDQGWRDEDVINALVLTKA